MANPLTGTAPPPGLSELVAEDVLQEQYGSTGQQLGAAFEGAAQGVLGPIAPAVEKALGVPEEDILGRAKANPKSHVAGQVAGFVGSALTGTGAAPVLGALGKAGAAAVGLGEATTAARIGSAAVANAIEGLGFAASDEVSKMVLHDPEQTVNSAIANAGLSTVFGGVIGAGVGSVSPLWKAASESQLGALLKKVSGKAGGADAIKTPLQEAIETVGVDLAPELKAALSDDPIIQQMAKTLEQSDTSRSGLAYQQTLKKFKTDLAGRAEEVLKPFSNRLTELSKAEAGKRIGSTLAEEVSARVSPLSKDFNQIKANFASTPVGETTIASLADEVSGLATSEGWMVSPSSDIAKQVNTILEELPNLKNLRDLSGYIEAVGAATSKDPLNRSFMRQGGMIKDILRKYEGQVMEAELGAQSPGLVEKFREAQKAYSAEAKLKDALDSRLHLRGATASYADRIREMAATDSETLLRRLSGKGDADLLGLLDSAYPRTAEELRKHIVDELLDKAVSKAKPGEAINANALVKAIGGMEPELRQFALPQLAIGKIEAVGQVLDKMAELPHNFSNTARTMDKLMSYLPGSAVSMATMAAGHNPAMALALGALTKTLGKDAPDALRLAVLKFMGKDAAPSAGGFKAAFDYIRTALKGEQIINKASEAIFKGGEVLPFRIIPNDAKRIALDKMVKVAQVDPQSAVDGAGEVGVYMPDHATDMGSIGAKALGYLAAIKPTDDRQNPLDSAKPINTTAQAKYMRALDIAEQPLMVLKHISEGTLTSKDLEAAIAIHPSFMRMLQSRITEQMVDRMAKGEAIPYKTRIGLSMLAQQPMDGTMQPSSILAAQPVPTPQEQQAADGQQKAPKAQAQKLNKVDTLAMTTNQATLARKMGVPS